MHFFTGKNIQNTASFGHVSELTVAIKPETVKKVPLLRVKIGKKFPIFEVKSG